MNDGGGCATMCKRPERVESPDTYVTETVSQGHLCLALCSFGPLSLALVVIIIIIMIKKIGNARPGEGDCHPSSPKTPAPHYQPIEEKKRKGK